MMVKQPTPEHSGRPTRWISIDAGDCGVTDSVACDLADAARDMSVAARYTAKIVRPAGTACWIWVGAISGRGHGRFRINPHRVVVAHRFGWVLSHPGEPVPQAVTHQCDNPLCQNPAHLYAGTATTNRADYLARFGQPGSPLNDQRGAYARAVAIRDAARSGRSISVAAAAGASDVDRNQSTLWVP